VCRVANAEFDAIAASVPTARHFVADCLNRWEVTDLEEVALLLTSELVSNSVTHAASGGVVSAAMAFDVLEIGVTDFDSHSLPSVRIDRRPTNGIAQGERLAHGGRGLMLVNRLADEWGVEGHPQGKHVWFRLHKDDWIFRPACRCDSEDVDRIRVGSGQFISVVAGPWDDLQ
jgi:sigma-B regulation protein RsbU (phosphoserine phosphatase)